MLRVASLKGLFTCLTLGLCTAGVRSADRDHRTESIDKRLAEKNSPVSPRADDAEFLRRLYLDVHGVIPPAEKVVAFLDSRDPDKRSRVIDQLLADPQFGRKEVLG